MVGGKDQDQGKMSQGREGRNQGQAGAETRVGVDREAGERRKGRRKGAAAGGDQGAGRRRGRGVKRGNLLLTAKLLRAGASSSRLRRLLLIRWQPEGKSLTRDRRITQPMERSGAYFGRKGTRSYRPKVEMQQITISSPSGFRTGPKGWRSYLTKKFW